MDVINNYSLFIIPDAFGKNTKCSAKKALSYSNANICDNWGGINDGFCHWTKYPTCAYHNGHNAIVP